jgi:hypothetical protein
MLFVCADVSDSNIPKPRTYCKCHWIQWNCVVNTMSLNLSMPVISPLKSCRSLFFLTCNVLLNIIMTSVYHRNIKSTNGIVEYCGWVILFGEFLVQISTWKPIILTVVLIVFSIPSRKMSKYIVHLIRLYVFSYVPSRTVLSVLCIKFSYVPSCTVLSCV